MHSLSVEIKLFSKQLFRNNIFFNKSIICKNLSSVQIGAKAQLWRTFTAEDVKSFAKLSGDTNPLHLDESYCAKRKFGRPVVHGALLNGLVSAVLGTVLPGPGAVIANQVINFTKPLYIDEKVCAQIIVIGVKKRFIECQYVCTTESGKEVLDGTARLVLLE